MAFSVLVMCVFDDVYKLIYVVDRYYKDKMADFYSLFLFV